MKIALGKGKKVLDGLYRGISKVHRDLFELKVTVTNTKPTYNIAIGFTKDELETLEKEAGRELSEGQ